MNIVFLDTQLMGPEVDASIFENLGSTTFHQNTAPHQISERIEKAEVIVTTKVPLRAPDLAKAKNLKMIAVAFTGTDSVDLDYCKAHNVAVANVAGYSTSSVVEQTFTLLFSLMRKTKFYDHFVKTKYKDHSAITTFEQTYHELSGKTWGIIGLGSIGKRVATIAEAFGAKVVYHSSSGGNLNGPYPHLVLDELCKTADIISIHAPLNIRTKNLINKKSFKLMKPSAYIVNTGRGGIINEADLAEALNADQIAGAGLDVFECEPIQHDNPLLSLDNPEKLITSPHIAWASIEARQRLAAEVVENIEAFKRGEARNRVV